MYTNNLNDIEIAEIRLADLNTMLDLTNDKWCERPINELHSIVSTACHINEFLINELKEPIERLGNEISEERKRKALTQADMDMYIEMVEAFFNSDENVEYLKANGHGYAEGHADEDIRLFGAAFTGYCTGRAYELNAIGKGEDAKVFFEKLKKIRADLSLVDDELKAGDTVEAGVLA